MVDRLNALVFSEDYPPYPGGIAQWAGGMAAGLSRLGLRVRVLTRWRDAFPPEPPPVPGMVLETMAGRRWKQLRTWYCYQAVKALTASTFRPDWIFATTWNFSRGILSLARKRGCRVVTVAHGLEVTRSMPAFKKAWMAKTLAASDFVVAVSAFTRSRVAALPGVRPERVLVFPNGVDSARYRPGLDVSELRGRLGLRDEKVVLTLARVVERKGHDTVIRSLPEVLGVIPDVRYVIAGAADAATMRRLRTLVSELQLGDRVLFTGFVAPHETALFYNLCDVYAMPSRELRSKGDTEGFGITFLEANACGKPVVAGRSGGVMDAVEEGETGLLVDPNDPDAVAGALIRFLAHPGFARKIGEQGRRRVLEAYTWDTISARMFQALREANPDRG